MHSPAIYNLLFLLSTCVQYTTNHRALAVICGESCSCSSCLPTSEVVGPRSRELTWERDREAEVEDRDIARPRPDNGLVPRLCFDRNPTYSLVLSWLRCNLSFSLLRSAITCLRGARSSRGLPARIGALDLAVSEGQVPQTQ